MPEISTGQITPQCSLSICTEKLNPTVALSVRNYERSKSDEVTAMTIQAETLAQLAEALQDRGMTLVTDVVFTRAPYRHNHRWICIVE